MCSLPVRGGRLFSKSEKTIFLVICYKISQNHWWLPVALGFITKAEFYAHLALLQVWFSCFMQLCIHHSPHQASPLPTRGAISLIHVVTLFRPWASFLSYGSVQGINIFLVKHKQPAPFCLGTLEEPTWELLISTTFWRLSFIYFFNFFFFFFF